MKFSKLAAKVFYLKLKLCAILFCSIGCFSVKLKGNLSEADYKSRLTVEKYTSINPETNGGYNREFTAVWKRTPKESVSIGMLLNVETNETNDKWFPLYAVWAIASGYSRFLIPYYRKYSGNMVLKSKTGDVRKVYELELKDCFGILLLNCALFEGFENGLKSGKIFENEIVYQAAYDYLKSSELPKK
ncbi:MAG TPA: hypothetical protein PL048_14050 [Leptospiraceae bacterium]|nr:hypothetical protein [Leptospiraceae bacterium]